MTKQPPALQFIKGIGPKLAGHLAKLDIHSVSDLLRYFPKSYEDRRQLPYISQLKLNETRTFQGYITTIREESPKPKLKLLKILLKDTSGSIVAVWFNQPYIKKIYTPGMMIIVKGKIDISPVSGEKQVMVSESEILNDGKTGVKNVATVVPIYALTHGVYQTKLREIIHQVITQYLHKEIEILPLSMRNTLGLIPLQSAIKKLHFPETIEDFNQARTRLVFDEFFLMQLGLAQKKTLQKDKQSELRFVTTGPLIHAHRRALPYTLTRAQENAITDIYDDMTSGYVMNRLIQGDVGAGKTDVAVMAILAAIQSGYSASLMAPTEILAVQHYQKIKGYLSALDIHVVLLKGKMRKKERDETLSALNITAPLVVIGTHALIEEPIAIPNLGLVIIDEQHRFGVMQRMKFSAKGQIPHALFMTATPIPRSLMLTVYGDLDKSIMDELPPGRIPAKTVFFKPNSLPTVYDFCKTQLATGQQVYMVFPLVEESEKLDLQAATKNYEDLKSGVFSTYKLALLHGKMPPAEKQDIMAKFKNKEYDILVATTVIEVGVDVPNSNVMIIHDAERFGLSQLHQLRGRVGRGQFASYCFLIGEPKSESGKKRIKAMLDTNDGFKIAEYDLQIRGPGDMLGTRQAGLPDFKLADLIKDQKLLVLARKAAFQVIKSDPTLSHKDLKNLNQTLKANTKTPISEKLN